MEYAEAIEKLSAMTRFGINLGLQRINSLLGQFAHPEERVPIIHIGGTNGKGSTLAMLSSILRDAGYRVGTYTSPHLVSYRERFMINGEMIPADQLAELLAEILAVVGKVQQETGENPTEFEVLTALAFLYFAREKVDVALIEVGLGGDIDSTNVVKKPLLSIITNVSLEHTAYLGTTLTEIAGHKSGIIKRGAPVLTASDEEEVLRVIRERAEVCGAPLGEIYSTCRWTVQETEMVQETCARQIFSAETPQAQYRGLILPFWGEHQLVNALLAIRAAEVLREQGWSIGEENIRRGLAQAQWPGRLEVVGTNPLIVLDGAHNPAGMEALAHWLAKKKPTVRRVILVIGMLDDKDRLQATRFISSLVDVVIITKPNSARAKDWSELKQYFTAQPPQTLQTLQTPGAPETPEACKIPVFVLEDLAEALTKALQEAAKAPPEKEGLQEATGAEKQTMILVTGSLYLIGEVKKILGEKASR